MRTLALAAAATLSLAPAALASPQPASSTVSVTIGPELHRTAQKTYGLRDVQRLADELRADVEREVARKGGFAGARIELVLVDAKPNRPTFKQLSDTPGLSYQSFGVGGATIEGQAIAADGTVTPLNYRWYETDIRQAANSSTWSDAEWTINRFASRLGGGEVVAQR